ncbi:MAG: hypothetical protein ACYC6F_19235 [Longimicrobiales bacterium]
MAAGLIAPGREARASAVIRAVSAVLEARHAVGALDEEERASLADLVAQDPHADVRTAEHGMHWGANALTGLA